MRPLTALALALATAVPTAGCCSLSRLFCGPDTTPWISESYDSPEAVVRTFLEAVRRGERAVVHHSLDRDFRSRLGIRGSFSSEVAWNHLEEEYPYVHVLGYADPGPYVPEAPHRGRFHLDAEGHEVTLGVRRHAMYRAEARFEGEETTETIGGYLGDLGEVLEFRERPDDLGTWLHVTRPLDLKERGIEAVHSVRIGYQWRIDHIEFPRT